MKATIYPLTNVIEVELTERNLRTLLLKLQRTDSARTLVTIGESAAAKYVVSVKAVPDEEHYADRAPGAVHPIEEAQLD